LPTPPSSPLGSGSAAPTASAGVSTPRKPASNGGEVTVYDEQEYVCKANDTFESISKQYLLSDKYAKALQRHNQNHARASLRMTEGGRLMPGEKIYIPQAYILEQRYADAIPRPAAAAASVVPATAVAPAGPSFSPRP
jgi:hypothetical protein